MEILTLRGAVLSKFKSISEFARAIGWKANKASRIINGVQTPSVDEIIEMSECLGIDSPEVFIQIFFSSMSTKWTA